MINIDDARKCLEIRRERKAHKNYLYQIGRVKKKVNGLIKYSIREIIVFKEEGKDESGIETLTIESPLSSERMDRLLAEGSLITANRTVTGVPASYIKKIE